MKLVSLIFIATLASVANAAGIGKAWEIAATQNTESPFISSRPRFESSAFEVLSVSGVGRLAPSTQSTTSTSIDETSEKIASSRDPNGDEEVPKLRVAKELDDLDSEDDFVPAIEFHDPTIEEFLRRSKEATEVEAFPRMWQKIRQLSRAARNHGRCSEVEEIDEEPIDDSLGPRDEIKARIRRGTDAEPEMEKIAGSTNVREARVVSPDSWSKQPLSVEFRHRTKLEEEAADSEEKSVRSRGIQAPRVDFVTSNRRSFTDARESREMPMPMTSRHYDDVPIYRNNLREFDVPYPRGESSFFPKRYRTERDFFMRPAPSEPIYQPDHYREYNLDLYGRNRPTPKPKRIIYYATLPEIVRKPVDLRNYAPPHDSMTRSTATASDPYWKRRSGANDPRYRYYSYPQGNYDNYDYFEKNRIWKDRPHLSYTERLEDSRHRVQDLDHASMRENLRNEETMLDIGYDRTIKKSRDTDKLPWPVQIGTEVSVKENERVTGRKIFGQREDYERFRDGGRYSERDHSGSEKNRN